MKGKRRTPVLAGDEVDMAAELDLQAGVAHEVLQPDAGDGPRRHRRVPLLSLAGGGGASFAGGLFSV